MRKLEFGTVAGGDLKENQIFIELDEPISACAGKVAIIKCDNIMDEIKIEEFVKSLNK